MRALGLLFALLLIVFVLRLLATTATLRFRSGKGLGLRHLARLHRGLLLGLRTRGCGHLLLWLRLRARRCGHLRFWRFLALDRWRARPLRGGLTHHVRGARGAP